MNFKYRSHEFSIYDLNHWHLQPTKAGHKLAHTNYMNTRTKNTPVNLHLTYALLLVHMSHLSVRFNGHFPDASGNRKSPFCILLELRMTEVVVTTGAVDVQSSSQIITTNKPRPSFYSLDAFPVVQPCQNTEGKCTFLISLHRSQEWFTLSWDSWGVHLSSSSSLWQCYWSKPQNSWEGNNACWLFHFNFTASLTLPSLQSHQIRPMDTRQQLLRTWKSAVVRMCRESGLQQTSIRPAEPSSILHVHSGCSSDQTCKQIITNTF